MRTLWHRSVVLFASVCERARTEKRDGKRKMSTDWCAGNFITHMHSAAGNIPRLNKNKLN